MTCEYQLASEPTRTHPSQVSICFWELSKGASVVIMEAVGDHSIENDPLVEHIGMFRGVPGMSKGKSPSLSAFISISIEWQEELSALTEL